MSVESEIYVPSVATNPEDLIGSNRDLDPAREQNIQAGIMIVLLNPENVEDPVIRQQQWDNISGFLNLSQEDRPVFFAMHPWKPLTGSVQPGEQEFNLLTNPGWSTEYLEKSIDWAAGIPKELWPLSEKTSRPEMVLTFHLSAYLAPGHPDYGRTDPEFWEDKLKGVQGYLRQISGYGARKSVKVCVETVPITPFSDWAPGEDSRIVGSNNYYRDLVTPWPLMAGRPKEIEEFRKTGLGVVLDWGHMEIARSSVEDAARLAKESDELKDLALRKYLVFESDIRNPLKANEFTERVLEITQPGDVVHANNSGGEFKVKELHGIDQAYLDGSSLTDPNGNIPQNQLKRLIRESLQMPVKFVVEVEEEDYEKAPNTKASLGRILEIAEQI